MKVVCYSCTRNWYEHLQVAVYSLLANNPNIDKVVCLIEDDMLPWHMDKVECINIHDRHNYFWENSPNYNTVFSPLSLYRLVYSKYLPYDTVLHLDVDTIVQGNIEELWDIDLTDTAICACMDVINYLKVNVYYFNAGVMLMNLKYIRDNHIDDEIIEEINSKKYSFPDQDVLNIYTSGHVKIIDTIYNDFIPRRRTFTPKVLHYAGIHEWWLPKSLDSCIWNEYKSRLAETL